MKIEYMLICKNTDVLKPEIEDVKHAFEMCFENVTDKSFTIVSKQTEYLVSYNMISFKQMI